MMHHNVGNSEGRPISDLKVRQAIDLAIDRIAAEFIPLPPRRRTCTSERTPDTRKNPPVIRREP